MLLLQKNIVIIDCSPCMGLPAEALLLTKPAKPILGVRSEDNCTVAMAFLCNVGYTETAFFATIPLQHKTNDAKCSVLDWLKEGSSVLLQPYSKVTFPKVQQRKLSGLLPWESFFKSG